MFWSGQFALTTGAAQQIAQVAAGGRGAMVTVHNPSSANGCYVGGSSTVSSTTGISVGGPTATAGPNTLTLGPLTGSVWAISTVGAQTITVSIATVDQ